MANSFKSFGSTKPDRYESLANLVSSVGSSLRLFELLLLGCVFKLLFMMNSCVI